jgi:hypothetical protein
MSSWKTINRLLLFHTYYHPKIIGMTVSMNIGLDYFNYKKLGKLQITNIEPNTKISIKNIKKNNLLLKKYRGEDYIFTILFSCIFGPITILSYLHDIYTNYQIKKTYVLDH